ncbi:Type 1 glutamine amidotransferase-like domain-containing protein [Niallia taxi]|uniref:Type 1 glutamine amidotransferase-like domain-containing protein n=1 Tax=Niallia taxi TaxID=2499688 RepID=UPI00317DE372
MGYLFLSGGGDKEQTKEIDQAFLKQINLNKPLLYIPIAMDEAIPFDECYKWINSVFKPLGIQEITMWTDLSNKTLEDLKQFSAIYIGGGNTFSLLNAIRISKLDKVLDEYIENEGVIYGGSAGAIILGSNIMTCAHMDANNANLQNFEGLNYIQDYSIWCHYEMEIDSFIWSYIKNYKKTVIALPEDTGIFYRKSGIEVIGTSPAFIFKDEDKLLVQPKPFI